MDNKPGAWIRWPGYLAWVFFTLLIIGVLTVRAGQWQQGLMLYALAGLLSLLVLVFMAVQSLIPRWSSERLTIYRRALPALPGAALLLMAMSARDVPPIHDITTDTADPPVFQEAVSLRGDESNPLDIKPDVIEQQIAAYPDVQTIVSPRSYASSYNLALMTARDMGWEITREDPNGGYIEAVETTRIMNFRDDIVIRVRTNSEGSIVDLRSVSRVGISDLGANAARIQRFAAAYGEAAAG